MLNPAVDCPCNNQHRVRYALADELICQSLVATACARWSASLILAAMLLLGGPLLALAYQHKPGPVLRSTVAMCFLVGEIISVIVLAASGKFTVSTFIATAGLLPFLAIGSVASRYLHYLLDGPLLDHIVLRYAVISGAVVIIQAWQAPSGGPHIGVHNECAKWKNEADERWAIL